LGQGACGHMSEGEGLQQQRHNRSDDVIISNSTAEAGSSGIAAWMQRICNQRLQASQ
jgi:hypothetical protein